MEKGVAGSRSSKCKSPEARQGVACVRGSGAASMVGWNGLGQRVEDELRGGGPVVWVGGRGQDPDRQRAEQARHTMEAGGAVFPLSWYFRALVVSQALGHNGEEADAVCLLRTWDQTKRKWTCKPVLSSRGRAAPGGGRCVCYGSEVGRSVEHVRAGSVVGGPGGPSRLSSVLGLGAGDPPEPFKEGNHLVQDGGWEGWPGRDVPLVDLADQVHRRAFAPDLALDLALASEMWLPVLSLDLPICRLL